MGCHFLLPGIFPTQVSNPGLLHCSQILYHLRYQGRPWDSIHTLNTYLILFPLHFKTPFLLLFPRKHQPEYSLTNQILAKIYTRGSWKGARLIKLLSDLICRSLISFQLPSTWGRKQSDTTERLSTHTRENHCLGFPGGSNDKESACDAGGTQV